MAYCIETKIAERKSLDKFHAKSYSTINGSLVLRPITQQPLIMDELVQTVTD